MFIQQGDILFFKADKLPESAKPLYTQVIAEGESTGHAHVAQATATLYDFGSMLFVVAEQETAITHHEHGAVTLTPGVWQVGRVKEFDPFQEQIRNVQD